MTTLRERIIDSSLPDHVLTDVDLQVLFDGTSAARYGLVNKAIKKGELIQLRRGLYTLANKFRSHLLSKFYLANRMVPLSYVSMESALSYHGWIPESVPSVTSVLSSGRTKEFSNYFGYFIFFQIPYNEYEFLSGVSRVEEVENEPFFLASPLRALADYMYIKKIDWQGIDFLTEGLRIEEEYLLEISSEQFTEIRKVYRSKRVLNFLDKLEKGLKNCDSKNY